MKPKHGEQALVQSNEAHPVVLLGNTHGTLNQDLALFKIPFGTGNQSKIGRRIRFCHTVASGKAHGQVVFLAGARFFVTCLVHADDTNSRRVYISTTAKDRQVKLQRPVAQKPVNRSPGFLLVHQDNLLDQAGVQQSLYSRLP